MTLPERRRPLKGAKYNAAPERGGLLPGGRKLDPDWLERDPPVLFRTVSDLPAVRQPDPEEPADPEFCGCPPTAIA